jgi:hypothetical protein
MGKWTRRYLFTHGTEISQCGAGQASPTRREGNEARLHKLRYSTIYGGKKKEPTWLDSKI